MRVATAPAFLPSLHRAWDRLALLILEGLPLPAVRVCEALSVSTHAIPSLGPLGPLIARSARVEAIGQARLRERPRS